MATFQSKLPLPPKAENHEQWDSKENHKKSADELSLPSLSDDAPLLTAKR